MKNLAASSGIGKSGLAKSSIKSVVKSANLPDGKVEGLKSNNGIENSVSGVEGKERSEAILETLFEYEAQHAEEFAQRDLDDDARWWAKMNQRTQVENMAASQKANSAAMTGGIASAGMAGIGAGLAGLAQKGADRRNESQGSEEGQNKDQLRNNQEQNIHGLAKGQGKDSKKFSDNPHQQEMQQNFQEQEMLAQNETPDWDSQEFEVQDATDPEEVFG